MQVRIRGIGPHEDTKFALNAEGVTTIRGASGSGKSTVMHATACALWGTDAEGAAFDRALLRDTKGSVAFGAFGRTVPTRGEHQRFIATDGGAEPGGTEAQFLARLPEAFRDAQAARLVMFPTTLWALLGSSGGGLALRQVLDRMLPGPTAAELLADIPAGFPRDPAKAALEVRAARAEANRTRGLADGIRATEPGALTEPDDLADAQAAVAAFDEALAAQGDARSARAAWLRLQAAHTQAEDRQRLWDTQHAALTAPTKREPTAGEVQALKDELDAEAVAQRAYEAAVAAHRKAQDAAEAWATSVARAPQVPSSGCPGATACQRVAEAQAARDRYLSDLGERPVVPETPVMPRTKPGLAAKWGELQRLCNDWAAHRLAQQRLGNRPADPQPLPEEVPEAPALPDVSAARAVLARWESAKAVHAAAVKAHAASVERRARAEADATEAAATCARYEGWLERVRTAPAQALAGKLGAIAGGALEVLDDDGKTEVRINGRPWYLASHGERIAAVAHWRVRLREAAGLGEVPVFVDDVSSVGRLGLPEAPGVVLLVTTAGDWEVSGG